jgi:GNAT superfamily N-acetyltransferase
MARALGSAGRPPWWPVPAHFETQRLSLVRAVPEDLEAMTWLPQALAPEWEPADLKALARRGRAMAILKEGRAIGVLAAVLDEPEQGSATLTFVGIEPGERFQGLGGEAALALEQQLRKRAGVERVLVPVPEQRGLAVYFWLRLGYRPLIAAMAPWSVRGLGARQTPGIWMARDGS